MLLSRARVMDRPRRGAGSGVDGGLIGAQKGVGDGRRAGVGRGGEGTRPLASRWMGAPVPAGCEPWLPVPEFVMCVRKAREGWCLCLADSARRSAHL